MEILTKYKNKLIIGGSLLVLATVLIIGVSNQRLKPENVGNTLDYTEEEANKPARYPEFSGEDIVLSNYINKELLVDEKGIHYFPNKTAEEVIDAFVTSSEKLGLINNTTILEQNLRYNSFNGDNIDTKLRRTLTANNEELTESIEISVYTDGNTGLYASSLILDIKSTTWERSNEMLDTVLNELNIDTELHESLLKSNKYFENIKYTDTDKGFTFSLDRNSNFSCNTSIIITHNTDDIESDTIYVSESLENFDEITADFNMINSSKYDYSYLYGENTFGNDIIDIVMRLLNKEYIGSLADSTFKGVKGTGGVRYNEEFNFVNSAISSDGELEVVVALNYLNGAVSVELDINNLKEEFTEEEKIYCRKALIDFLNVTYEGCGVTSVDELLGPYSKNTTSITDADGNQYTVVYGEIADALMLNYMIEGYNENTRSEGFKNYR